MRKAEIVVLVLVVLTFAIGIYVYPTFPDRVASHWNAAGEVDGFMSKFGGLFLLPSMLIGMFALYHFIQRVDPLKENIKKFLPYFDGFMIVTSLFLLYIYGLTLGWNLGFQFNMTRALIPGIGILFFYVGVLLKHAKRNWFIGIRTPWTLSSDVVWDKTHRLGSVLFTLCGVVILSSIFFAEYLLWFMLVPVIGSVLFLFGYSYVVFKKVKTF